MALPVMTAPPQPVPARRRAFILSIVLWAFGLATTTLLVGIWGRSVAADTSTIRDSALAMLDPETVSDQVTGWAVSEVATLPGIPGSALEIVIRSVAESPAARIAVASVVTDVVGAANAPPGTESEIDVAGAIEPLRPAVIDALDAAGYQATPAEVDGFLRQIEGLVLTSAEGPASSGAISTARSTLTTVMFVGAGGLLLFGGVAVRIADDRSRMLRSLANRLIVSALTFALFLRIGAWAVDPRGGRSPLRESGAILLSSNQGEVLGVAVTGVAISALATIAITRLRRSRAVALDVPIDTDLLEATLSQPELSLEGTPHRASVR